MSAALKPASVNIASVSAPMAAGGVAGRLLAGAGDGEARRRMEPEGWATVAHAALIHHERVLQRGLHVVHGCGRHAAAEDLDPFRRRASPTGRRRARRSACARLARRALKSL